MVLLRFYRLSYQNTQLEDWYWGGNLDEKFAKKDNQSGNVARKRIEKKYMPQNDITKVKDRRKLTDEDEKIIERSGKKTF